PISATQPPALVSPPPPIAPPARRGPALPPAPVRPVTVPLPPSSAPPARPIIPPLTGAGPLASNLNALPVPGTPISAVAVAAPAHVPLGHPSQGFDFSFGGAGEAVWKTARYLATQQVNAELRAGAWWSG